MDLFPSLGELIEAPGPEQARIARMLGLPGEPTRVDFTNLFVVQLFPYASIYLSPDGLAGGQVQDRIADYWKVLRRPAPPEVDHASTLLRAYGTLTRGAQDNGASAMANLTDQMRHAFFWENLASWLPIFLLRTRRHGSRFYNAWSDLTLDALEAEAAAMGSAPMTPLHLRNAPMPPSIAHAAAFVDGLFVPVVSGLILSRSDLGRCARDNELTIRFADRRYTIKLLLAEKTGPVCKWLQTEAQRQAEDVAQLPDIFTSVRTHWLHRLHGTSAGIREFAQRYSADGSSIELV
jgi:TorA maturation chaperone TorD